MTRNRDLSEKHTSFSPKRKRLRGAELLHIARYDHAMRTVKYHGVVGPATPDKRGIRRSRVTIWLIGLLFSSVAWWTLIFGLLAPRMKP